MLARKIVHTLCGVVLLGVLATSATGAMTASRTTYFTFSGAVEMPQGVSLAAGTYIFEVANPDGGSDVVQRAQPRSKEDVSSWDSRAPWIGRRKAISTPPSPSAKLLPVPLPR